MIKRFRILSANNGNTEYKADTVQECVEWLQITAAEGGAFKQPFFYNVECLEDDIQVCGEELIEMWNTGERPNDLQMF